RSAGEAKSFMLRTRFSRGFPIRRDCLKGANGRMPASFALIQSLNQFLNQQTQLRVVTFICHRRTKFAPIFLHAVSHHSPPIFRCEVANPAVARSMFDATTLSCSVASC